MKYLALLSLAGTLFAGQPRYARLAEWSGHAEVQLRAAEPWIAAERNLPLPESTWLRTAAGSRLEIELDEGSVWRLGPESAGAMADYTRLSTGQRITLLSVDRGLGYFTGQAQGRDCLVLAVPGAQVTVTRNARIRLDVRESSSWIAVLRGGVRFSSPAAELDLREGQVTRVEPANPSRFFLYREIEPLELDGWSEDRDKAIEGSTSAGHVPLRFGAVDLDAAGEWVDSEELGTVWKPKMPDGWAPFRNGRWRWYDGLGYTWLSAEPWGWLPYHYGRWTRTPVLGWIWVPGATAVFKPGDVYWMRGKDLVGWGPLGPGETFPAAAPGKLQPQLYLNATTTFAAFADGADSIDPTGFESRPKDPLAETVFIAALPSPAFLPSKLEAARPLQEGGRSRVVPMLNEVTFETATVIRPVAPPPAQPIVIITQPPPPPADPVMVAVPYAVPVPVVIPVAVKPAKPAAAPPAKPPAKPAPAPSGSGLDSDRRGPRTGLRPGPRRNPEEGTMLAAVTAALAGRDYQKALSALSDWTRRYPESDLADQRLFYAMQAYHNLNQSDKVIESGTPLLSRDLVAVFGDQANVLAILSMMSLHVQRLAQPAKEQLAAGATAAKALLAFLPVYFTEKNRPPAMTVAAWSTAQSELEALAKLALALAERRPRRTR